MVCVLNSDCGTSLPIFTLDLTRHLSIFKDICYVFKHFSNGAAFGSIPYFKSPCQFVSFPKRNGQWNLNCTRSFQTSSSILRSLASFRWSEWNYKPQKSSCSKTAVMKDMTRFLFVQVLFHVKSISNFQRWRKDLLTSNIVPKSAPVIVWSSDCQLFVHSHNLLTVE